MVHGRRYENCYAALARRRLLAEICHRPGARRRWTVAYCGTVAVCQIH